MNDLIARQAAIDSLISFLQLDGEYAWGIRECLNALPSAQDWIPTKDRIPEKDCICLVTVKEWFYDYPEVKVAQFHRKLRMYGKTFFNKFTHNGEMLVGKSWINAEVLTDIVTAWTPLPEPYREGDSDGV